MLSFAPWVSDKTPRISEYAGWGKDGAEKLTEYKKLKKPWTSEMESTTFYRGISNIDAHLLLSLLATFWSEVEHENESSETLHTKYSGTVFMKWWTLIRL